MSTPTLCERASRAPKKGVCLVVPWLLVWYLLLGTSVNAQWELALFTGDVQTMPAAVEVVRPAMDLTFSGVRWDSDPLGGAPYYGIRFGWWPGTSSRWGLSLEFTHFKVISQLDGIYDVTGRRGTSAVDSTERLNDTFKALDFSNGNNIGLLNVMYRWHPEPRRGTSPGDRWQLYAGLGAGISVPHANIIVGTSATDEYQFGGLAVQGQAGAALYVGTHFALLIQYKLSHSRLNIDLAGGGTLRTHPWTHHINLGFAVGS